MRSVVLLFVLSVFLCQSVWANVPVGEVVLVKGNCFKKITPEKKENLSLGSKILEKDTIVTSDKSIIKIKMDDETILTLGPKSTFEVSVYKTENKNRIQAFHLFTGKLRAKIIKKAQEGEKLSYKTDSVAIGVRGTEFLTNAYLVDNAPVSDTALLSGKTRITKGGEVVDLEAGDAYNSAKGIQKLSPEAMKSLNADEDSFLPELQKPDGSFLDMKDLLVGAVAAVAVVGRASKVADASVISSGEKIVKTTSAQPEKKVVEVIHKYEKEDPWDIKDAKKHREKMHKKNVCYYWEYKVIPGSPREERFRRETECDDLI